MRSHSLMHMPLDSIQPFHSTACSFLNCWTKDNNGSLCVVELIHLFIYLDSFMSTNLNNPLPRSIDRMVLGLCVVVPNAHLR